MEVRFYSILVFTSLILTACATPQSLVTPTNSSVNTSPTPYSTITNTPTFTFTSTITPSPTRLPTITPTPNTEVEITLLPMSNQKIRTQPPISLNENDLVGDLGHLYGEILYGSQFVPDAVLYFENIESGQRYSYQTLGAFGQPDSYDVNLPTGSYLIYGWHHDYHVPWGLFDLSLFESCGYTFLQPIEITHNQNQELNINISESRIPDSAYPNSPVHEEAFGIVEGRLAAGLSDITLYLYNAGQRQIYLANLADGQTQFRIMNVPAGQYFILAVSRTSSGELEWSSSLNSSNCTMMFRITSNEITSGINLIDPIDPLIIDYVLEPFGISGP